MGTKIGVNPRRVFHHRDSAQKRPLDKFIKHEKRDFPDLLYKKEKSFTEPTG
mgnify:CR=1 FL=1